MSRRVGEVNPQRSSHATKGSGNECAKAQRLRDDLAKAQDQSGAMRQSAADSRYFGDMMKTALAHYLDRMQRTLDHIDQNLDGDLDLDAVSRIAAFSKFHFHRQFVAVFGMTVHRYIQLARMKRASYQLLYRDAESITDIAMGAGYEAPEAFSRAFRQRFGQSPSAFRSSPDWRPWLSALETFNNARNKLMNRTFTHDRVVIREVPTTPLAIFEHRGDSATLGASIQRFIAWRKAAGLSPKTNPTFNIWHSERHPASPTDYAVDLCVGTDKPFQSHGEQIKAGHIPGGRCAVLRVVGHTEDLEPAATFLYREWLPASGEEARDFPIYCQRLSFFPDVPEQEAVAELFLPIK